jgi:hypothetical protein
MAGRIAKAITPSAFAGNLSLGGSMTKLISRSFLTALLPSGSIQKSISMSLSSALAPAGRLRKSFRATFGATLSPSGALLGVRIFNGVLRFLTSIGFRVRTTSGEGYAHVHDSIERDDAYVKDEIIHE